MLVVQDSILSTGNLEIIAGQSTVLAKRILHLKGRDIYGVNQQQPFTVLTSEIKADHRIVWAFTWDFV